MKISYFHIHANAMHGWVKYSMSYSFTFFLSCVPLTNMLEPCLALTLCIGYARGLPIPTQMEICKASRDAEVEDGHCGNQRDLNKHVLEIWRSNLAGRGQKG